MIMVISIMIATRKSALSSIMGGHDNCYYDDDDHA